ncbi:MAG: endonuclease [Clostridiales bacterium]|nr:endonuclease [Clostridiales bacterium]
MDAIKGFLKLLAVVVLLVVLALGALVGWLSFTEYLPGETERLTVSQAALRMEPAVGDRLTVVTFNTGYAALDRTQDFFMDGGKTVRPESEEAVRDNMAGMLGALDSLGAQIVLLQEVDEDSSRSFHIDQKSYYRRGLGMNAAMAYNYKCEFVPFPWPPFGKVTSGVVTLTELNVTGAERISLPVPFQWPVRTANLKRCLLVERVPVKDTDKELVIINLHLEAYDDGEGRAAQTRQLLSLMEAEVNKGNYVIAGGDFNQTFPEAPQLPVVEPDGWQPMCMDALPEGFSFAYDASSPTCRSLSAPYSGDRTATQFWVIDGFILSDNLKVNHVETVDLNFRNSDHNPVLLQVTLQ